MIERKVLFVTPSYNSFIKNDIEILSSCHKLIFNHYNWNKKILIPFYLIHQFISVLVQIKTLNFIFIEFGGFWSFIPTMMGRLFNLKSYIVLHGTDCASFREYNYGSLRRFPLRFFCYSSYKMANCLIPVSDSLVYTTNFFQLNRKPNLQGYKYHFPDIKTPAVTIHNGIDSSFWKVGDKSEKIKNSFISVFSESQYFLKGGDLILEMAYRYPSCTFTIVGTYKPNFVLEVPSNLHFLGVLSKENLRHEYRKAEFHFQLSSFEGFGMSLCEAMLCGCVPIGSQVNMIPEIIGNCGFILKHRDPLELFNLIHEILNITDKNILSQKAAFEIQKRFNMENRSTKLLGLVGQK